MFVEKNCNNTKIKQIDSKKTLLTKIDKNFNGVLMIILDMLNIYIKYLNQANHANKQYKEI